MKRFLRSIFIVTDNKTRLARSLVFGSLLALIIGFASVEVSKGPYKWDKEKKEYKPTIILMGFVLGSSLSYSVIKEEKPSEN